MRRFLIVLIGLVLALLLLLTAGPQVRAWYHLRAGRTALEHYHAEEARGHFAVCCRTWPGRPDVYLLAGRADRLAGDLEAARTHLEECQRLEQTPSPQSTLEWILLRATGGDLDEVEQYLLARADKEPEQAPWIWEALAEGYLRMYRILDAVSCLDRWLAFQPDNPQALFLRGSARRRIKNPQKATPDFQRAVELDPERDDARWELALCLTETGRFDEALAQLETLRPRRPGDTELLIYMARCQGRMGRMKQAQELLDGVLADHPDSGLALRGRGELADLNGDLPEAEAWLWQAVRVLPYDYPAHWELHEALRRQGKTEAAKAQAAVIERLKKRLERLGEIASREMTLRPHDPALRCELGTLLLNLGHPELGERWLLSALAQDPNYAPAHTALAEYYQAQGDAERAAEHRLAASARRTRG
jgi:tetratricopeptide (TPR) repeat protein